MQNEGLEKNNCNLLILCFLNEFHQIHIFFNEISDLNLIFNSYINICVDKQLWKSDEKL